MNRINCLRKKMAEKNVAAIFISNIPDIYYLSGFTGSTAYMIITNNEARFFTDGRYTVQSGAEVYADIECIIVPRYSVLFKEECPKYKHLMLQSNCDLATAGMIKDAGTQISVDEGNTLSSMRLVKDEAEIIAVKNQYLIAAEAFKKSLPSFKSGVSEISWAACLEYNMKILGARGASFETIVASGVRSCLPHGAASSKIVEKGEPVIIDFGSIDKYASDYTRMIYSGNDKNILHIIQILKDAVEYSIDGVREGVKCSDIDKIARDYITEKDFGEYFNHSLGHGVGLDVHELPVINSQSEHIVEEGMIFTIEPGIYLPGKFGARLEDTVLVKNGKAEVISFNLDKYVYNFD